MPLCNCQECSFLIQMRSTICGSHWSNSWFVILCHFVNWKDYLALNVIWQWLSAVNLEWLRRKQTFQISRYCWPGKSLKTNIRIRKVGWNPGQRDTAPLLIKGRGWNCVRNIYYEAELLLEYLRIQFYSKPVYLDALLQN